MEPNLIIALRQPWLALILHGTKTAELRRTRPLHNPARLYLYHRGCIHGHAQVTAWIHLITARQIADQWGDRLCMSRARILEYLEDAERPIVYGLGTVTQYQLPIPIARKPQSWIYMDPETAALIPDLEQ